MVVIVMALAFGFFIAYLFRLTKKEDWLRLKANISMWAGPLTVFIAVYTMVLPISTMVSSVDRISSRYMIPIYVPAIVLILSLVYQLLKRTARKALIALAALSLFFPLVFAIMGTMFFVTQGAGGYNSVWWRESATIRYLRSHALPRNEPLVSNEPVGLAMLAKTESSGVPRRTAFNSSKILRELESLKGTWPEQSETYLIWFGEKDRGRDEGRFTLDELKTIADIRLYQRFSDGAIYAVSRIE